MQHSLTYHLKKIYILRIFWCILLAYTTVDIISFFVNINSIQLILTFFLGTSIISVLFQACWREYPLRNLFIILSYSIIIISITRFILFFYGLEYIDFFNIFLGEYSKKELYLYLKEENSLIANQILFLTLGQVVLILIFWFYGRFKGLFQDKIGFLITPLLIRKNSIILGIIQTMFLYFLFYLIFLQIVISSSSILVSSISSKALSYDSDSSLKSHVKTFLHPQTEKKIILIPMVHIANTNFYQNILTKITPYLKNNNLFLLEGVSDQKKIFISNSISYNNIASSIGLASQEYHFSSFFQTNKLIKFSSNVKFINSYKTASKINTIVADLDVSNFNPSTIKYLKHSFKSMDLKEGNLFNSLLNQISSLEKNWSNKNQFRKNIILLQKDLIDKRNNYLISVLKSNMPYYDSFIIPWGALHIKGISQMLKEIGYIETQSEPYSVFKISLITKFLNKENN